MSPRRLSSSASAGATAFETCSLYRFFTDAAAESSGFGGSDLRANSSRASTSDMALTPRGSAIEQGFSRRAEDVDVLAPKAQALDQQGPVDEVEGRVELTAT